MPSAAATRLTGSWSGSRSACPRGRPRAARWRYCRSGRGTSAATTWPSGCGGRRAGGRSASPTSPRAPAKTARSRTSTSPTSPPSSPTPVSGGSTTWCRSAGRSCWTSTSPCRSRGRRRPRRRAGRPAARRPPRRTSWRRWACARRSRPAGERSPRGSRRKRPGSTLRACGGSAGAITCCPVPRALHGRTRRSWRPGRDWWPPRCASTGSSRDLPWRRGRKIRRWCCGMSRNPVSS